MKDLSIKILVEQKMQIVIIYKSFPEILFLSRLLLLFSPISPISVATLIIIIESNDYNHFNLLIQ